MVTLNIRLGAAEEIRSFVNLANHYPFTILLRQDRYTVDGKSLLGIYSLDLRELVHIDLNDDDVVAGIMGLLEQKVRHIAVRLRQNRQEGAQCKSGGRE